MGSRIVFALYRVLLWAAFPILLLYGLRRISRDKRYFATLKERLGWLPVAPQTTPPGGIWLHAVSVGEVLGLLPLLKRLRLEHPDIPLWMTTSTLAGRAVAEVRVLPLLNGLFYAPLDYPFAVRRFLRVLQPRVLVVTETEIWPTLWREVKRSGCGLVVVNGRISARTARTYSRWRWFFRHVFQQPDAILVQEQIDLERYLAAGAPPERTHIAGNFKYDFEPEHALIAPDLEAWVERSGASKTWIAASTIAPVLPEDLDEDEAVLNAFEQLSAENPTLLLILAPRKPARFDVVARMLETRAIRYVRRTRLRPLSLPGVLLLDSVGDLNALFQYADAVFVGGSVASHGGHNVLEPGAFGKPVATGPHMQNFQEIYGRLNAVDGIVTVRDVPELVAATREFLQGGEHVTARTQRAWQVWKEQQGATGRALACVRTAFGHAVPVPPAGSSGWLWPLSLLWIAGGYAKRAITTARALPRPVVSIGNLTVGGTGKTPVTRWLIEKLTERGYKVAVLSRGYKRESRDVVALPPGSPAQAGLVGDEPMEYLEQGLAWVGIGADRYEAGSVVLDHTDVDVFLLDDGFQHARLDRVLDLLLLDANAPFSNGFCMPAGRLREPLSAVHRAHALILTRCAANIHYSGMRDWNGTRPMFQASGQIRFSAPVKGRCAAFCGLADPRPFVASLRGAGLDPLLVETFPDHHSYSIPELRAIARHARDLGATTMITTNKDAVKALPVWPGDAPQLVVAHLDLAVDNEEELLRLVLAKIGRA